MDAYRYLPILGAFVAMYACGASETASPRDDVMTPDGGADGSASAPDGGRETGAGACTVSGLSVDAGHDQLVVLPNDEATFTALASDSNGGVLEYVWSKVSGPAATLDGATTATLTAKGLTVGNYVFRATVSDGGSACASADVALEVRPAGTVYYVSTSQGDDGRSASEAQNPATPWRSLAKLDWSKLAPGDEILFRRGDVFTTPIEVKASGEQDKPIVLGAYGSGPKPLFSGFVEASGWTSLGGNVWETTAPVTTLSSVEVVTVDGVQQAMGRYPNAGYLTYTSHAGTTSITIPSLSTTSDWVGGELVVRRQRWILDRSRIVSVNGKSISYTYESGSASEPADGYGAFIQDHPATLDSPGEWWLDPSTKKLRMYATSAPSNVRVSAVPTMITVKYRPFVMLDGLAVEGTNGDAVLAPSKNLFVQNCDILLAGDAALRNTDADSTVVQRSTFDRANGCGACGYGGNATVRDNSFTNIGLLPGAGHSGHTALEWRGEDSRIESNRIDHVGYDGILFNSRDKGSSAVITRNVISKYCVVTDDCAGIYVNSGPPAGSYTTISENIILDGVGAGEGTNSPDTLPCNGIYTDDGAAWIRVSANTVAHMPLNAIFFHGGHDLEAKDNLTFDTAQGMAYQTDDAVGDMRDVAVHDNVFVALAPAAVASHFAAYTSGTTHQNAGVFDHNVYARPVDDTLTMFDNKTPWPALLSLASWQAVSGQDANSTASPRKATDQSQVRFEYNDTTVNKTIPLGGAWVDMHGQSHSGQVTLPPYRSIVLLPN
jgi:hypothetical protein